MFGGERRMHKLKVDLYHKVNILQIVFHYIIRLFLSLCTPFSTNDDIYYICNNTNLHVSFVCIL